MNIDSYLSKQTQEGEEVVRVVRRHPALMSPALIGAACLLLLDFFLISWWWRHAGWGPALFMLGVVIAAWVVTRTVYIWRNNILVVTSFRIIDVDQRGLFERHVAEAALAKVQDVRYTVKGMWPTLLSIGTLVVQTAGTTTNLEISGLHHPVELQRLITDLQQRLPTAPEPISSKIPVNQSHIIDLQHSHDRAPK